MQTKTQDIYISHLLWHYVRNFRCNRRDLDKALSELLWNDIIHMVLNFSNYSIQPPLTFLFWVPVLQNQLICYDIGIMAFLWWQSLGYDYTVVIMIVISNHGWKESQCVISAAETVPEWLSALDDSDGGDLRHKRSAGTSTDKCILYFWWETADNLSLSAGGSSGRWGSWMTLTTL